MFSLQEYQIIPSLKILMLRIKVSQSPLVLIKRVIPADLTLCLSLPGFKSTGQQTRTLKPITEIAVLSLMIYVAVFRSWTVAPASVRAQTKRCISWPNVKKPTEQHRDFSWITCLWAPELRGKQQGAQLSTPLSSFFGSSCDF